MSGGKELYELQDIDLEADAKKEALREVANLLGAREALLEVAASLDQTQKRLAELETRQQQAEWQVEDIRARSAYLEEKLYGGSVRNPRELVSLQEEIEQLKARQRQQEDEVLDIMSTAESVRNELGERSRELEQMEAEWQQNQSHLLKEQQELSSALETLEQKRRLVLSQIDSASLALYEALRPAKQGRAVAKVKQGMCQGCRLNLPMGELQQLRMEPGLVQCSNCGRILYVN